MTPETWIALGAVALTLLGSLLAASNRAGALTTAVEQLTVELRKVRTDIEEDRRSAASRADADRERHDAILAVLSDHGARLADHEARLAAIRVRE